MYYMGSPKREHKRVRYAGKDTFGQRDLNARR